MTNTDETSSTALPGVDSQSLAAGGVRVTVEGAVLTVVLDRPDSGNAQTPATWRAFAAIGANLPADVRVVVLRTTGPTFSIGLDRAMFSPEGIPGERSLGELVAGGDEDALAGLAEFQSAFTWWQQADAITVAAVQGEAVGAGFHLALACDLRVLTDDAQLSMPEAAYGVVPDLGGTKPLVEFLGYARALEIAATGRAVSAAEALRTGMANAVVAGDALDSTVDELVKGVLNSPKDSVAAIKALLRDSAGRTHDEQRKAERVAQVTRVRALVQGAGH